MQRGGKDEVFPPSEFPARICSLPEKPFDPPQAIAVRGAFQVGKQMGRGTHHGFGVAEQFETVPSVVGTHPALSHSSEGEMRVDHVYDGVVDAYSARCRMVYHVASPFPA